MNNMGILSLSTNLSKDLKERLPKQRKNQRESLSLLTATMLLVRSPNTVDLASALPRKADRIDMRYQWISRFLSNTHINVEEIMHPYAVEIFKRLAQGGGTLI